MRAAGSPRPSGGRPCSSCPQDVSDTEKIVNWANWTAYLDYDDKTKKYPTLEAFKKQTGIKATYAEDIDDNDSYFGKSRPSCSAGQDIGGDIFVLTDWMANRVIRRELRPAARADPDAEREEPARQRCRTSSSTRAASTR